MKKEIVRQGVPDRIFFRTGYLTCVVFRGKVKNREKSFSWKSKKIEKEIGKIGKDFKIKNIFSSHISTTKYTLDAYKYRI